MQKVFIQKIFQITEHVLRRDTDDEAMLKELNIHLRKAQQMGMDHYEAEVLNTLGILYSMQGQTKQAQACWRQALEKAAEVHEPDLSVKLLNNLTGTFLDLWDVEQAMQYAQLGMQIAHQHKMKSLTTLYIYGTAVGCHMALGQYAQAEALHTICVEMAEKVALMHYSRFEYAQIITAMHEVRVQLDLVARDESRYQNDFATFASFVEQIKRDDFYDALDIQQLFHALIMTGREEEAQAHEDRLKARHQGTMPLAPLLPMANFLFYNQQRVWARRYAQMLLDRGRESVSAAVTARAREILAAP